MEKDYQSTARECLDFIAGSVSAYHAVENVEKALKKNDFRELLEEEDWDLHKGGSYYVKRNASSILAFRIPEEEIKGFHIMASHSDSPCFKVKPGSCMEVEGSYKKLDVEPYGGMIHATWLDRCLSVAGRIVYRKDGKLVSKTVNVDEDLLVMPNLAIHMNREMNKNLSYNPQTDLQPLIRAARREPDGEDILLEKVASWAGVDREQILGKDLFLYVREKGRLAGAEKELVVSPRLDDLQCVFASLKGFLKAGSGRHIAVCAVFDNEEVGSLTRQGAASTFLKDTLERTLEALKACGHAYDYRRLLAGSFMISADNAQGVHPNYTQKADPVNRPYLNQGIVIKYHAGQKYTTDAYSEAVMRDICREAGVCCQTYSNRSDIPGGSTLGNLCAGQVPVSCVDIGLAQLAMHSAVETAGAMDIVDLVRAAAVFFGQ